MLEVTGHRVGEHRCHLFVEQWLGGASALGLFDSGGQMRWLVWWSRIILQHEAR